MNKRVIPGGHDEEWDHVDNGKNAGSMSNLNGDNGEWLVPVDSGQAECNVRANIRGQGEQLEPRRQHAHVHRCRQLELAVMPLVEYRGVEEVFLEAGIVLVRPLEVALLLVCEAHQLTHVLDGDDQDPPDYEYHRHDTTDYENELVEEVGHRISLFYEDGLRCRVGFGALGKE